MNLSQNKKAYIALIIGFILIGVSPILIKLAHAPGIVTSFYRLSIGTIVLSGPFIYFVVKGKCKLNKKGIRFAVLGGICFSIDMSLWSTGIVATNATIPTLVGNLAPLWVGIGAMIFFKEKQKIRFWLGLLLAIAGVALLVIRDFFEATGLFKGIFLGLMAGVFYAGYQLFTQPGRKYLDTLSYLFISSLTTSIILAIIIPIFNYNYLGYDNITWILWLIMGVGLQAGAWFLINYSQGHIPASVVSPTLLGQPVITAIVGSLFLDESLTFWQIIGGIVIILGVYIVYFNRSK
ncbi:MAG: DMT family transporter [Bacteroidales bacterium]|nr:DMT family transporter [Bacteroidales bacterium]MBN2817605.1 DMT family transporter [Bacteroidales bacterium]